MKYLSIIFSLILITSCATTQSSYPQGYSMTTEQRFAKCTAENINKYIGNCVIETIEEEPPHYEWVTLLNMEEDWKLLVDATKDIDNKYRLGELDTETSNLMFTRMYGLTEEIWNTKVDNLVATNEAERIKKAQMWMAVGEALKTTPSQYPTTTMPTPVPIQKPKVSYRLDSEYVEGRQKICVYKNNLGQTEFVVKNLTYARCDLFITK